MSDSIPGYILAGAVVRKPFSQAGERIYAGAILTRHAFEAIGYAVRRIWVRDGMLTPFYVPAAQTPRAVTDKRYAVHTGGGRYDVIEGTRLNADPLTRDQADALCASEPV